MKFFTNGTWRPRVGDIEEVLTPISRVCLACGQPIRADDCGILMLHTNARGNTAYQPWHLACFQGALGIEETKA
jgi:hypothetical protein